MNDNSIMPFGKHKGKPLLEVPASYLLWWADQSPEHNAELLKYINDNRRHLEDEARSTNRKDN